jgi:nucleotide-binding universal stress UspA family protein
MAAPAKTLPSICLKNILFATDFSSCSEAALPFARAIATRFGSVLHFIHVLPAEVRLPVTVDYAAELDAELQSSEREMAEFLLHEPLKDVSREVLIRHGVLWQVLEEAIREHHIDLIVLGTHGRHGLPKLALGSVAEEVLRRAECPVLTVGPRIVPDGLAEGRIDPILYATDVSDESLNSLPYALAFARENKANLLVLHALAEDADASPATLEHRAESWRQYLRKLVSPKLEPLCTAEFIVLFAPPADAILRAAREHKARLIVMGAKRSPLAVATGHLPWTTAHHVVCEAPCPVITVRQ